MTKSSRKINVLDLFTGIGGFPLALKKVPETRLIGYCDNDPRAQAIIQKQIQEGSLDDAPIFDDVSRLSRHMLKSRVDIICAGSPCQDFSVLGTQKGIFGTRSVLIFEVLRLVEEVQPHMVFFENSPQIVDHGLAIVCKILNRLGYETHFVTCSAAQVGAYHLRKRFFMVAYKTASRAMAKKINKAMADVICDADDFLFWRRHPIESTYPVYSRMIPKTKESLADIQRRMHLLGNALVPQTGIFAIYKLTSHVIGDKGRSIPHVAEDAMHSITPYQYTMRIVKEGYIQNEKVKVGDVFTRQRYSTPVAGCWSMSKIGSRRSVGMLTNEVLYDQDMLSWLGPRGQKHVLEWVINPNFIEYLMGYPRDWTK